MLPRSVIESLAVTYTGGGPVLSFRSPCGVWAAGYLAQCLLDEDIFDIVSRWQQWAADPFDIETVIGDLAVELGLSSEQVDFIAANIAIDDSWAHFVARYHPEAFIPDGRWRQHLRARTTEPLHWISQ